MNDRRKNDNSGIVMDAMRTLKYVLVRGIIKKERQRRTMMSVFFEVEEVRDIKVSC